MSDDMYDDGPNSRKPSGVIPGRQAYHLDIPSTESASSLSVVSFEATERMGAPTEVRVTFTHPDVLPRADYLNREASFSISPVDGDPRQFSGFIARFSKLKTTADFSLYEVLLTSHFARLAAVRTSCFYQHRTTPQIIEMVLRRHDLEGYQFAFRLRGEHPQHDFRMQHDVDDLTYVQMLMQKEGIYSYLVETEYGDQIVFGDDIDHYIYQPALNVPYRETAGLEAGIEAISSLQTHTQTVSNSIQVADYNPSAAWERLRSQANIAPQDGTTYGQPYIYGTHHLDAAGAKREAQLRHEVAIAWQVVYTGESNISALQPARILRTDIRLEDAPEALVIIEVTHSGARNKAYTNTFKAIPSDRRFRLKLEEDKWPKINGTMSARVTSPDKYKYAYQTVLGHYTVRFDPDLAAWPAGGESVPLRLAKPFAGAFQTGFHFPALDGTEAVIEFRDGDPDKPYIAAFHHNSQATDLITNDRRWMSRNVIRTQSNNKLRMEDWSGQEGIKLSTEHSGKSQLILGYMVNQKLEYRGEGYELRTSGYGAIRSGRGVMITAYDQPGANGKQLDMAETVAQLKELCALAETLVKSAEASKATPADTHAQQAINDALTGLKQPGALITAPGPVGVVSGDGVQFAADGSLIATAKKGVHFSTLKHFTVAAGRLVSLFAQKGLNLIAAAGPVAVQAQRGPVQLAAQEDVTVETVDGVVHVKSPKEIVLNVDGTYLRMTAQGIEMGTRGRIWFRTADLSVTGPAQMDLGGVAFAPQFVPFTTECEVWRKNENFTREVTGAPEGAQQGNTADTGAASASPASAPDAGTGTAGNSGAAAPTHETGTTENTGVVAPTHETGTAGNTGGTISPPAGTAPNDSNHGQLTISDPNAPAVNVGNNLGEYPEPVRMTQPAPCNWALDAFEKKASIAMEVKQYHKYGDSSDGPLQGVLAAICPGPTDMTCRFAFDSRTKILTTTVVIALVPVMLVEKDPVTGNPLRDSNNNYINVVFDIDKVIDRSSGNLKPDFMALARNVNEVNASTYKGQIERTLNQGNYKLILAGCTKGAACGCRVSVKFCADIHVVNRQDAQGLGADCAINLYDKGARVNSGNWSEKSYEFNKNLNIYVEMTQPTQLKTHEVGHLFAFPDEYWQNGGSVHKQYVKSDGTLDFLLGSTNAGASMKNRTWQLDSQSNLMGHGCWNPTATTPPYYLEYIRRWFSTYTNKSWRVGYDHDI